MTQKTLRRSWVLAAALAATIAMTASPASSQSLDRTREPAGQHERGYNPEYIFAATYGLTGMDVPAPLKVPLVPVTLVMDIALLPFEVVAGCFD